MTGTATPAAPEFFELYRLKVSRGQEGNDVGFLFLAS